MMLESQVDFEERKILVRVWGDVGWPIMRLAERIGRSHERASQILRESGQYQRWHRSNERYLAQQEHMKRVQENLDTLRSQYFKMAIAASIYKKATRKDVATKRAVEYVFSYEKGGSLYEQYKTAHSFYARYSSAKRRGKRLSVEILAKGIVSIRTAYRMIEFAHLPVLGDGRYMEGRRS